MRKLHGDGCCCTEPSETFRVRPRYDYEKKHVSRDSKMCCCCWRFCCLWCSDDRKEYTHRYSMMHRRLPTAGIEVAPHHHQLLVYPEILNFAYVFSCAPADPLTKCFFFNRKICVCVCVFLFGSAQTPHEAHVEACLGARFLLCLRASAPMMSPNADHAGVYFFGGDGETCPCGAQGEHTFSLCSY